MTRKQEIIEAAREYTDKVIFSVPSDVIYFEAGAKWADEHPNFKNIWHKANKEPKEYPIICQDELHNVWIQYSLKDYVDGWKEFKECECIIRWAYIKDLLPKRGEK